MHLTHPRSRSDRIAAYDILGGPPDESLQGLVDLAALVCEAPMAAINLITEDQQHQPAAAGVEPWVCGLKDSMCVRVLDEPGTVVSRDARVDPRFADHPYVDGTRGEIRFYSSAPLTAPDGQVVGRLCVFDVEPRDLSEQRQRVLAEVAQRVVDVLELRLRTRQLEESRDELHRSNELLSLFAGQVSHDLRSPLTAIISTTEVLASEPALASDPELAVLARSALQAGHRMDAMIQSILDFTQVGARLRNEPVDLDAVLDDVLSDLCPVLEERAVQVRREPLPQVRGDRQQLHAVLLNVVSNAVKYTPPGRTPEVGVRAERVGGSWAVTVTDNGRGVPPEQREALFGLYQRGPGPVEGTGIGLATARRVIEAHGGRIGMSDGPDGVGTRVWFLLPQ